MEPKEKAVIVETVCALGFGAAVVGLALAWAPTIYNHAANGTMADVNEPATMLDAKRWEETGCTTDTDCERFERWRDLVCTDGDACEWIKHFAAEAPSYAR